MEILTEYVCITSTGNAFGKKILFLQEKKKLMCNFYSQVMVFPGYILFHLIVGKLFSLQNLALSLS